MIDTHCHIIDEAFEPDRAEVIARCKAAGVDWLVQPACSVSECEASLRLQADYPDWLRVAFGIHPENVGADYEADLTALQQLVDQHQPVAIGEIGMDLYWDKTYRTEQMEVFRAQVELALKHDLPILIHTRNAWEETFSVLQPYSRDPRLRGIFHCFSGSKEIALRIQKEYPRFYFGIGGVLTFKKASLPDTLQQAVPIDKIVLETDAPYMAPVPHRGKRNESSFLIEVEKKLAEVYQTDIAKIEKITNSNAKNAFL